MMNYKKFQEHLLLLLFITSITIVGGEIRNDFAGQITVHFDSDNEAHWHHDSNSEILKKLNHLMYVDDRLHRPSRVRRAAFDTSTKIDPHAADCVHKLKTIESTVEDKVVQMVVTKEINEDAAFTCTFCGDPVRRSMLWFRLERSMWEGVYRINEIIPDMHDDPRLNRVYVEVDHTLIIEKPTIEDAGTYFCKDHTEHDHLLKNIMTPADIKKLLESKDKLRFLYHFDVIKPNDIPVKEVSRQIPGKEPLGEETYPQHNFLLITKWAAWGRCSACGEPATQKRHGTCAIKKMYEKMAASPWYVEAVLNTYGSGVPCRSSVFTNHKDLTVNRPDEIESRSCNITCVTGGLDKAGEMSAEGIKLQYKSHQDLSGKPIEIKVREGDPIKMKCPGTGFADDVFWFNGTYPMKRSLFRNNTRVIIHFTNTLEIKETYLRDTKRYKCYSKTNLMGKFDVKIAENPYKNIKEYLIYIWYTYPFNFLVFLVLMLVKHKHRRVAIAVPKKRLDALASDSGNDSNTTIDGPDLKSYFQEAHTGLMSDEHGSLASFYDDAVNKSPIRSPVSGSFAGSNFSRSPPRSIVSPRSMTSLRSIVSPPRSIASPRSIVSPPRSLASPRSMASLRSIVSPPRSFASPMSMASLRSIVSPPRSFASPGSVVSVRSIVSPPRSLASPRSMASVRSIVSPPRSLASPRSMASPPRSLGSPRSFEGGHFSDYSGSPPRSIFSDYSNYSRTSLRR